MIRAHKKSPRQLSLGKGSWTGRSDMHTNVYPRDPAELVATVSQAKREILMRAKRHWLRREDLEDCYSQATLELVLRARRDNAFTRRAHIENALEQKLMSRIHDRRRALSGRAFTDSTLENALRWGEPINGRESGLCVDTADPRAGTEQLVADQDTLLSISIASARLTSDQRLVLASQIAGISCRDTCARFGWSDEKYRKVAQRGRSRLRATVG